MLHLKSLVTYPHAFLDVLVYKALYPHALRGAHLCRNKELFPFFFVLHLLSLTFSGSWPLG